MDVWYFHITVGLHQGSALSSLLFILIMDVLQAEIGKESPWVMLFADDLVIGEHSRSCVAARKMERDIWVPRTKQKKTEYIPYQEKEQTI